MTDLLLASPAETPLCPPPALPGLPADVRSAGVYFAGVARAPAPHRVRPAPAPPGPALRAGAEHEFLADIFARAGLRAAPYRETALARRLPACLRFLGVNTLPEAAARIAARPALVWGVLDVVLLGVTEFCRDRPVFERLRMAVLPELCRNHVRPRAWSAACSEGQELYSVAACFAGLDALERCELLGTDCRPEAIARAREGEYPSAAATRLPQPWRRSLLIPAGDFTRIHPRLRTAAAWRVGDLLAAAEPGPWHLILCRNFAIYLEPAAATDLWRRLAAELAPGGYLVTGKAENPSDAAPFARVEPCIFRKRST